MREGTVERRRVRGRLRRLAPVLASALATIALSGLARPLPASAAPAADCGGATDVTGNSGGVDGTCNTASGGSGGPNGKGGGSTAPVYPFLLQFCGSTPTDPLVNYPAAAYRIVATGPIQFKGPSGIVGFYGYDARPGKGTTTAEDADYVQATVQCLDGAGVVISTRNVVIPRNAAVIIDPTVLRDEARARITIGPPPIITNPAWDQPGVFGVVRLPTWLWLDPAYWAPATEGAAQGPVVVTVTATPRVATWSPGDGSSVTCAGPGVPWHPGLPETATTCSHTYLSSSADRPGATYQLGVQVRWEFTWTLNGVDQGPFGVVNAAAAPVAYQVGEIQAVGVATH